MPSSHAASCSTSSPERFVRVRHYGLLANGVKARRLAPGAQPARHPRASRAVQGQARVLARRLSPSRGKGPATLPRLSRRPARRGGRHPPLTDPAAPRVSFQVAVNPSARLSRRKLAAVRRSTCLRAALATLARSPLACPRDQDPAVQPDPAILRLASPGTITVSGANRLAYNPHTARIRGLVQLGCSRSRPTSLASSTTSRSRLREQPCTFDGPTAGHENDGLPSRRGVTTM